MSLGWSQLNDGVLARGKVSINFVSLCNKNQASQNRIVTTFYGRSDCFHYKKNEIMNFGWDL